MFSVRYGQSYRVELSWVLNKKTGRWIMSRIVIVTLRHHRHKPIYLLTHFMSDCLSDTKESLEHSYTEDQCYWISDQPTKAWWKSHMLNVNNISKTVYGLCRTVQALLRINVLVTTILHYSTTFREVSYTEFHENVDDINEEVHPWSFVFKSLLWSK
jgi:hypothetical protein